MPDLFAHPARLWLLTALVPWALWARRGSRRRLADWRALGQSGRPSGDGTWLRLVGMGLLALALGQPRWGRIFGGEPPPGHDVVVLVDVSRSMAAEDALPDRLGVAIESASGLLRAMAEVPGNRASVVAFAGRGVTKCPMTEDIDAAIAALGKLRPGDVQPGGTDLGSGLDAALDAVDDEEHAEGRAVVVFSDGEDHAGSWASALDRLRAMGIPVHSVAIGDPDAGHPVPGAGRPEGRPAPIEAITRRSDRAAEAMARATGGVVVPLGLAPADLGSLYRDRIAPMARRRRDELRPPERAERFPAFVLAGAVAVLVGSWPGPSRGRARRHWFAMGSVAAVALSLGPAPAGPSPASSVAEGVAAYGSGRFAESLAAFERAITLDPTSAVARYDAGAALFRLGRFAEAASRYTEARDRADPALAIKVDYALGNARLALDDLPGALAGYDACLASTLAGPVADAVRRDAALNRAFVSARIKPPPEEPDQGDPGDGRPDRARRPAGGRDPGAPDPRNGGRGDRAGGPGPGGRGAGGAGGGGQAPPKAGSPDARLDAALRNLRESARLRAPEPPPRSAPGVTKDW